MRKLLIVEDELIIRRALLSLPWETIGVEEVAEASNGKAGLEVFEKMKPQVVLTDINMPFMDGITMGKEIAKKELCQIIFLTGYSEFSYAQAAVSIKAFDYILKPVDATVLLPQVANAFQLVEEEAAAGQQKIISQFLFSNQGSGEEELRHFFGIDGAFQCFFGNFAEAVTREATEKLGGLALNAYTLAGVLPAGESTPYQVLAQDEERLAFIRKQQGWLGFSSVGLSISDLPVKMLEARTCCEENQALAPGIFLYHADALELPDALVAYDARMTAVIEKQQGNQLSRIIEEMLADTVIQQLPLPQLKAFLLKQIFLIIHQGRNVLDFNEFQFYQRTASSVSFEEAAGELRRLSSLWQERLQEGSRTKTVIQQALEYVDQHFADEDISLPVLADHIHVSTPYLSNLFKSETGKNYTECLFERRMTEAYRLLGTTDKPITEIALDTGFANSNYFSSCFKKHSGMSPKQYRKGN